MTTFFWHDYETFGAIPKKDRPAQFAGIRTDMELNEVGEPIMIYCKPTEDCIPSPEACLITKLTPQECLAKGVSERVFAQTIEQALALDDTIGVGFNSIRFDDEVTRYLFWRNLIDPYAREWKNGCSRWDLIDVTRALYALKPGALHWSQNEAGLSFKLQDLSKANDLAHEHAHEALSDVRATIGLARLIKKTEPKFFDFCLQLRHKKEVLNQLSLDKKRPLLHVSGMYPTEKGCLGIVWPLAMHPTNKNEVIVWDLSYDPRILLDLDPEQIKIRLFTRTADLEEGVDRLPIKTISINKSPFVMHDLRVLKPIRALELGLDLDEIQKNAKTAQNLSLPNNTWDAVFQRAPFEKADVDEDLYGGFIPDTDRFTLERLRHQDENMLATARPTFQDLRLKQLFFRYRARHFPETLTPEEKTSWHRFCADKRSAELPKFWEDFHRLYETASDSDKEILEKLRAWI